MKIEVEILEDQLELLGKIKTLPALIQEHIGDLPQSWPAGDSEYERIKELCEQMEFQWKKWVYNTIIANTHIGELMQGMKMSQKHPYDEED